MQARLLMQAGNLLEKYNLHHHDMTAREVVAYPDSLSPVCWGPRQLEPLHQLFFV